MKDQDSIVIPIAVYTKFIKDLESDDDYIRSTAIQRFKNAVKYNAESISGECIKGLFDI